MSQGQGKSATFGASLRARTISEREWESKYRPIDSPDGSMTWERKDMPDDTDAHYVWSWADAENGATIVMSGYHVVNVYGYAITEVPWTEDIEVHFDDSDAEKAIEQIELILWYDPETRTWDRNKEWDSDTMTQVANVLTDYGFGPDPEAGWFENKEDKE